MSYHLTGFLMFFRHSITSAFFVAFLMTFFSMFDVPVFWPILLFYWLVLFIMTMRRQIAHMIKYKYIPFSIGKQVRSLCSVGICIILMNYAVEISLQMGLQKGCDKNSLDAWIWSICLNTNPSHGFANKFAH